MKRWEYTAVTRKTVLVSGNGDLVAGLDAFGMDGWELVVVEKVGTSGEWDAFTFKREVPK